MKRTTPTTHPMVIVAATAATIASLAATAHYTGLLPKTAAETATPSALLAAPTQTAAPIQAAIPEAKPVPHPRATVAPKPRQKADDAPPATLASNPSRNAGDWRHVSDRSTTPSYPANNDVGIDVIPARPAMPVCNDCGIIESVREVSTPAEGSGLGAVAGGVVGGLLGKQVGKGNGSNVAAIVGALGGAYAGNQAEKHYRAEKHYEVTVRMDDGTSRTYTQETAPRWRSGERIRLSNGNLLPV